jgi:hypothetical protein
MEDSTDLLLTVKYGVLLGYPRTALVWKLANLRSDSKLR